MGSGRPVEEERCKHEMLPGQCSICKGLPEPEELVLEARAELLASGGWYAARYAGRCDGCGRSFPKGAAIQMAGRGWRAECCAESS